MNHSSLFLKTCKTFTCLTVLSFGMANVYGMRANDMLDEEQTSPRGLLGTPATPENARMFAENALEKYEESQDESEKSSFLRIADTCYSLAIERWTGEGRAELLFDAANVSFLLWEKEPSEYKEKEASQLFAQALEAYGEMISGYQLQMAAGFYLSVFKKDKTKVNHLKEGNRLMLKGINLCGGDTSPASLLVGALYHFRLWKFDKAQMDVFETTIDLYNRAVLAFGNNPHPKLIDLKQRIEKASRH